MFLMSKNVNVLILNNIDLLNLLPLIYDAVWRNVKRIIKLVYSIEYTSTAHRMRQWYHVARRSRARC